MYDFDGSFSLFNKNYTVADQVYWDLYCIKGTHSQKKIEKSLSENFDFQKSMFYEIFT